MGKEITQKENAIVMLTCSILILLANKQSRSCSININCIRHGRMPNHNV